MGVLAGDGHWLFPDLAQQEAQDIWHDSVFNLTQTGFIDGLFVDGCAKNVHNVAPERQTGKIAMLQRLQADIPGPLICGSNGVVKEGLGGSQIQNWGKGSHWATREIPMLQRAVNKSALFQAHGSCPKNMTAEPQSMVWLLSLLLQVHIPTMYVVAGIRPQLNGLKFMIGLWVSHLLMQCYLLMVSGPVHLSMGFM